MTRKLSQRTLGLNGIEFFAESSESDAWKPKPQIAILKQGLLDFAAIIPQRKPQHFDKDDEIPKEAEAPIANEQMKETLSAAKRIVREAKTGLDPKQEYKCQVFVTRFVFGNWMKAAEQIPLVNLSNLDGAVAVLGPNTTWCAGHEARKLPGKALLSRPKPDFYLAIRIHNPEMKLKGFLRHNNIFHNFTIDGLIAHNRLTYSPSAGLKTILSRKAPQLCFPFVIAEFKGENFRESDTEYCYCQAANASSTALAMLCKLSKYVPGARYWWGKNNGVLPVVSFTFIGAHAKLWLSYVSNYGCGDDPDGRDIHQYEMRCIWTGDFRKLWNAIQLVAIVNHIQDWFLQVYRPWVSACLDLWRHRRTRKNAYREEKRRRFESGESPFHAHQKRWEEPTYSDSEAAESNCDDDGDYDDETGSIPDCLGGGPEPKECDVSSNSDETESDDSEKVTITEVEELGNEAMAALSLDDGTPISTRTRSRSHSLEPFSERVSTSPWTRRQSRLSPNNVRGTSARPNVPHLVSSPLESRLTVRVQKPRRRSALG